MSWCCSGWWASSLVRRSSRQTCDPVGAKTTTIQGLITRYMGHGHRELQYRFYAGGRHEILNEPEHDRVQRDIGHWLSSITNRC